MYRPLAAALLVATLLPACGSKRREPASTTQGTSLHVGATAMTPQVNIGPQGDAGATQIQIGNVQARLPGEDERGRAAERATQEGAE
jgi:hypothetical protein